MSELVYPPVIAAARLMFRALDMKIDVQAAENIPTSGGVVLASNHVSYLDFIFAGLAAQPSRRLVRFMAKQEIFDHRIGGPLMRGMHHIPVDRAAGAGSYKHALTALRGGEVIGVFPEATISRSFTVKEIKSGACRLAAAAEVPLVPVAIWGTQRLWTKGRPRRLTQRGVPISILVGEPMSIERRGDHEAVTLELRRRLSTLVEKVQRDYPERPADPAGAWWLPTYLGGSAPTPEEAAALDARRPERPAP